MHELGIVYHIIRDVENVARAHGVRRVSSVTLLLGEVSGCDYATVEHGKTCPQCGSGETYLLQGQEVMIKQIETPDEDPADAAPDGLSDAPDAVDAANPLHIA